MIFKRRHELSIYQKIRNYFWPSMGFKRTLIYYKYRLLRLPNSSHEIAMGLASGCVVSWTPTIPFQILQCFVFCKITRANFIASIVGTSFGNPWTFPILFYIAYKVGSVIVNFIHLEAILHFVLGDNLLIFGNDLMMDKFLPTLIGGYVMAALTYPLFYYSFVYSIRAGRASKRIVVKTAKNVKNNIIE